MVESAVYLRGAVKVFGGGCNGGDNVGGTSVLRGLDMTVPRGSIGCGKTTLLRCALGRVPLDAGEARVLGLPPGAVDAVRVGYMPQRAAVEERMDLLVPLLQLPPDDRLVKTLSGGQQRRVSLAAAIVHAPELLILDEPTVGLDPLLRHSIWEYLTKLTEGGKATVIITTHYVEEAQQAHIVGLMRHGKLLAEDAPQHLISLYDCITLEEVFLGMSVQQDQEIQDPSSIVSLIKHNFTHAYKLTLHIIGIFLFPFLQISLFFLAIGGYPTGINLAVVNDEIVDISNCDEYRDIFNDNSSYCTFNASSCLYLNIIDNSLMNMVFYGKMDEAFASVKSGKAIGVIHFPQNFSSQLEIRLLNGIHTNNDTLQFSEIGITMDMTEQHTATLVKTLLYDKYNTMVKQLSSNCDIDSTVSKLPMQNDVFLGHYLDSSNNG
ncbi:Protein white [Gryllus bimaculatus]|nr:Protein white [Gryllus bimaculatus]